MQVSCQPEAGFFAARSGWRRLGNGAFHRELANLPKAGVNLPGCSGDAGHGRRQRRAAKLPVAHDDGGDGSVHMGISALHLLVSKKTAKQTATCSP